MLATCQPTSLVFGIGVQGLDAFADLIPDESLMGASVDTVFDDRQVLRAIVHRVAVDVMNVLVGFGQAAIMLRPDIAMFGNIAVRICQRMLRHSQHPVASFCKNSHATRGGMFRARSNEAHVMTLHETHWITLPVIALRNILFCKFGFLSASTAAKPARGNPSFRGFFSRGFLHAYEGAGPHMMVRQKSRRLPSMVGLLDNFLSTATFTFSHANNYTVA